MPNTLISINGQTVDSTNVKSPKSRHFREAWTLEGDVIEVDMNKAREIQKGFLRQERAPHFQRLDAEYMMALEQGDSAKQTEIATKKQELRDVTKHSKIKNAKTPETLEALTLDKLVDL